MRYKYFLFPAGIFDSKRPEVKHFAFTLSEVLITLGIIGVIAAMTIPALITRYQKFQTVTKLKGAYSQLAQAIRLSQDDNGDVEGWDLASPDWFQRYLASYMKVTATKLKDFNEKDSIEYKETSGKRETGLAIINNAVYGGATSYTLLNGVQVIVADSYRGTSEDANRSVGFVIDLNGPYSLPNRFGKDAFMFSLNKYHGLVPSGMYTTSECTPPVEGNPGRDYLKNTGCYRYACNKQSRGMFCAALIVTDGWQIAPDYPW